MAPKHFFSLLQSTITIKLPYIEKTAYSLSNVV